MLNPDQILNYAILHEESLRCTIWNILQGKATREDVEEVLSTTYFKAHRHASHWDGSLGNLLSWLKQIARNAAYDRVRQLRRQQLADLKYASVYFSRKHAKDFRKEGCEFSGAFGWIETRKTASDAIREKRFLEDQSLWCELWKILPSAMRNLSEKEIRVFRLWALEGMECREISHLLMCKENVVKSQLHRAKLRLRKNPILISIAQASNLAVQLP